MSKTVTLVTANMDKERGGDAAYLEHLRSVIFVGVLFLQEVGHGVGSTKLVGVDTKVRGRVQRVVGRIGVHRGIAVGSVVVNGVRVKVLSVHGLHIRTSGKPAQDAYYARLAKRATRLNKRGRAWVIGADFNRSIASVAHQLGGTAHGEGIVGFVVSRGITVLHEHADTYGKDHRYTDHPAYVITITTKEHR